MDTSKVILISGPTGVGKTAFVDQLSQAIPIEIINGDVGQMYLPFSIGTAKPPWRDSEIPHHLFDILSEPVSFSAMKFRRKIVGLIQEIFARAHVPVIVGGSAFYLLSLFFPVPDFPSSSDSQNNSEDTSNGWQALHQIDPQRAREIDPSDSYRIERALAIWRATGVKPSVYKPVFEPFAPAVLVWISRDREQLYERINARVDQMLHQGWVEEVRKVIGSEWELFLRNKKLIGYDTIISYCDGDIDKQELVRIIAQKTRNYAKRQITFWRSFKEKIEAAQKEQLSSGAKSVTIQEFDLTHGEVGSYIKLLKSELQR